MNILFDTHIEIKGHQLEVQVQGEAILSRELYGQDADGNRGEWMTFVDILEITVLDQRENDITKKLEKNWKAEFDKLWSKAEDNILDEEDSDESSY